jgi:hypothetical protein
MIVVCLTPLVLLSRKNSQQSVADAEQNTLRQQILIVVSSKAGANERQEAHCGAGQHESSRTVFIKDGTDDGAAEEEDEELLRIMATS